MIGRACIGNCDSLIYLGGNEYATFEWLSKYIGKMTERTKSQSIGRGSRGSSSDSYQLTARDLCSPDELRRMDDGIAGTAAQRTAGHRPQV